MASTFTDLNEVSDQMMIQIFSPLLPREDSTLPVQSISCRSLNPFYFSGAFSAFTPACQDNELLIKIDGKEYKSVDQYVWEQKYIELIGMPPTSTRLRGDLKHSGISMNELENWVIERGILYLQKAILQKVMSDQSFYMTLMSTGNRYIFYTYTRETFYGTGKSFADMTPWLESLKESNVYFKTPLRFPVRYQDLVCTPVIPGNGHNVLGIIYMALRESIISHGIHNLKVSIPEMDEVSRQRLSLIVARRLNQVASAPNRKRNLDESSNVYPSHSKASRSNEYFRNQDVSRSNSGLFIIRPYSGITPIQIKAEPDTYSTMSTPRVSAAPSEIFNMRNWQSINQLEMIRQKTEKLETERLLRGETPLGSEANQERIAAMQAIEDEEFLRNMMGISSTRTANSVNSPKDQQQVHIKEEFASDDDD